MLHGDLLGERARLTPEKTALVFVPTGARFTYRELDERAARTAEAWRSGLGLSPGDRVGLLAHNRPEFLDAFFAAGKSGIILVPLGTRLTSHELEHVVRDSGMRALLYDGAFADTVRALRELVTLEHWVALDAPADPTDALWSELISRTPDPGPRTPVSPEDPYCLLYTSGTTGRPKGVILPHRMVTWNAYNTAVGWQLREDDVSPVFTPLYHAGGLGAFLTPVIAIGGTIVLHAGFDPAEVWRTMERERCTVALGVPTIWKLLMEVPEFATVDLSHVRWFISGGAPLPLYIIESYLARGVVFRQGYGLTEVGVNCFAMTDEDAARKKGAIGKPLMFTEARLVDDDRREVPVGEVGELLLRGPHVCRGYWNNPAATAAALDADGWFHTGDSARRDQEGFFSIAGRKKDMFISGGVNVYPAEIEGELLLHPQVQDAAVIGVPDETWGEVGAAFIVLRPGDRPAPEALAAYLETRIARYKIPRRWIFANTLPRTAYGKVVKAELAARLAAPLPDEPGAPDPGTRVSPPETPSTRLLAHRVDGRGEPVLLLNGGMMSIASWDALLPALAARYRVVRCDFRGQLRSPGVPHASLDGHVADVVHLLDALGTDRAHVIGTSFGGEVGILLAATAPERVASLTAVAVTDLCSEELRSASQELRMACREALAAGDRGRVHDLLIPTFYSTAWAMAHADELALRREQVALLPDTWFAAAERLLASLDTLDLRPWLGNITCPTLIVAAESDRIMPLERARALAAAIPGARLEVVPGSGHVLVNEQPGRLARICLDFLSQQAGAGSRPADTAGPRQLTGSSTSDAGPRTPDPDSATGHRIAATRDREKTGGSQ
ncbi:MAG: alpha/beta fold hydrolase [Acidobacteriota bacterium]